MKNYFLVSMLGTALTVTAPVCVEALQSSAQSHSNSNSAVLPQGTELVVELAKSIDARKAKPGDKVKADVTQDVIAHGELLIRTGSKVEGHVIAAKGFNKEARESRLEVVFDKVRLKGGGEMTVDAVLQALAPHVEEEPEFESSSPYDGSHPNGAQPVTSGWRRPRTVREARDHTRDNALAAAADPSSYGTGTGLNEGRLSAGSRGVIGMPGISLKLQPPSPVPVLESSKASIKLESGTQMVLEIQ